jgi:ABC-type Fe3+-siderophore transport system permease subunit
MSSPSLARSGPSRLAADNHARGRRAPPRCAWPCCCWLAACWAAAGPERRQRRLSLAWATDWDLIRDIRMPRTLGALAAGALLGLAGAIAQGLFRNPLADPYLLGSAAGAGLGVVLVLAAGGCWA